MEKQKFIMLIGLPGSGKSTYAKTLMKTYDNIVYLSSDEIREELFEEDIFNSKNNGKVFEQMNIRMRKALKEGKSVIYDATNINRKRRKGIVQQVPKNVEKIACFMSTPYKTVLKQNLHRKEKIVPDDVIEKYYKNLHLPIYSEGWDYIKVVYHDEIEYEKFYFNNQKTPSLIRNQIMSNKLGYSIIELLAYYFNEFNNIYELPHDSKYHSFSVSRHIYHVYKYVIENYHEADKELMAWTALLHDVGKAFCKSFYRNGEQMRYANFIGHENVGAQLALNFLYKLGFDNNFIYKATTLIQFHMYLLNQNMNIEKLKSYLNDEDLYNKLVFLRQADTEAH